MTFIFGVVIFIVVFAYLAGTIINSEIHKSIESIRKELKD